MTFQRDVCSHPASVHAGWQEGWSTAAGGHVGRRLARTKGAASVSCYLQCSYYTSITHVSRKHLKKIASGDERWVDVGNDALWDSGELAMQHAQAFLACVQRGWSIGGGGSSSRASAAHSFLTICAFEHAKMPACEVAID